MTKDWLRVLAEEAGFDEIGFAAAGRAPRSGAFHSWLAEGCHAGMGWLAREPDIRCDPRLGLSGARTVIALAMNYYAGDSGQAEGSGGIIARYARGRDYHNLIRKRLRPLDKALASAGGTQRCFVDSGPLLEREFASLAGIAWIGKSSLALHPRLGTWFFLAAIATTLEFEADSPRPDRCGSCTRCISACPTGAIVEPYKVDARRCLSYWTIEHRGSLPEWVRPLLGRRIFGCDDCLEACPWNRFARVSREADFRARDSGRWLLRDYLALGEAEFRALFEGSPIRRAGRSGFLRNVCVALGNSGGAEDIPALEAARHDADPVVAEHAAWALSRVEEREP